MKCPNCGYIDGFDFDTREVVRGEDGGFYILPIEVKAMESFNENRRGVCGCPKCSLLFMPFS